jgi:2,3-dihydroxy-2,3-dihydro-p-cumate dehydrogenase
MNKYPLEGRVAIVTGAGRGIGEAIARRMLDDGAKVVFCDLTDEAASAACDAACSNANAADAAISFHGNLAKEEVARALIEKTMAHFGKIDILVNNAGGGILRPFLEHTPATLVETIDRNLWTAIWCSWLVLPHMKAAGFGRIINLGADSVRNGLLGHAGYNAAKGGMHGMTTGLAREFALDGITVNTVAPCAVRTPQFDEVAASDPALIEAAVSIIPMGRPGTEDEIASMVAYLASDDAGFVTGQVISVNGGTTML